MAEPIDMNARIRARRGGGRRLESPASSAEVNALVRGGHPAAASALGLEDQDLERLSAVRQDQPAAFAALHPDVRQAVIRYDAGGDTGGAA